MNGKEVAIVTGGASGIGMALAAQLAARGMRVIVADIDGRGADAVATALGDCAEAVCLDVTDAEAFSALANDVIARHGRVDWLINNAGVGAVGFAEDVTLREWKRVIDVNLWGVIHGVAAVYPHMIARGAGQIVNVSSGSGLSPRPGMTPYATAKTAVVGLTMSLRVEAARHGVNVSVACPGYVTTNIVENGEYERIDMNKLVASMPFAPLTADQCATVILNGATRRRSVIIGRFYVWFDWMLYRISPRFALWLAGYRLQPFWGARV